ncbi:hypothetical protein BJY24_001414 [Nocardia transvalensis]|uniref:Uncharacterized protein n=1 Tax=Nocardia transvalensis TaxID=37333 RepID=A0A7W9PAK2_9NOCA|nr:DUF2283 domain-containing protein [Nocardia transvalensis]MBB5912547.1 hypothetical protein [Nocardia transvalensis]
MTYPRIELDRQVNAASLKFAPVDPGGIAVSRPVEDENGEVIAVLRFAPSGELVEVELLDADHQIPRGLPIVYNASPGVQE